MSSFKDFLTSSSQRRKVVPKYFETYLSHLPVNNIGETIQCLVFYGSKNTSSALNEDNVREEMTYYDVIRKAFYRNCNAFSLQTGNAFRQYHCQKSFVFKCRIKVRVFFFCVCFFPEFIRGAVL